MPRHLVASLLLILLAACQDPARLPPLPPAGAVRVVVLDPATDEPIANARVWVLDEQDLATRLRWPEVLEFCGDPVRCALTLGEPRVADERGELDVVIGHDEYPS